MNDQTNNQIDEAALEQRGYIFARGMDRYNTEKESVRQKALYDAAKEQAHKAKLREDIIVKSLFTAAAGAFAGRAVPDMGAGASAGAVAGCGIIAMLGDYAYDWVIRKPISFVKNLFSNCFNGLVDSDSLQVNVNVHTEVKVYDREMMTDKAIIEKAVDDARACNYAESAEKLAELQDRHDLLSHEADELIEGGNPETVRHDRPTGAQYNGEFNFFGRKEQPTSEQNRHNIDTFNNGSYGYTIRQSSNGNNNGDDEYVCDCTDGNGSSGCNRSAVFASQTLLLVAAAGAACIPNASPYSVALKVIGGVVSGGFTALMSSVPYIADSSNNNKIKEEQDAVDALNEVTKGIKTSLNELRRDAGRKGSDMVLQPAAAGAQNGSRLSK